jgi:hypothetical protein
MGLHTQAQTKIKTLLKLSSLLCQLAEICSNSWSAHTAIRWQLLKHVSCKHSCIARGPA